VKREGESESERDEGLLYGKSCTSPEVVTSTMGTLL